MWSILLVLFFLLFLSWGWFFYPISIFAFVFVLCLGWSLPPCPPAPGVLQWVRANLWELGARDSCFLLGGQFRLRGHTAQSLWWEILLPCGFCPFFSFPLALWLELSGLLLCCFGSLEPVCAARGPRSNLTPARAMERTIIFKYLNLAIHCWQNLKCLTPFISFSKELQT